MNVRRVDIRKFENKNSMWYWTEIKNPLIVARNYVVISICRILPSLKMKNYLLEGLGVKLGKNVAFGLESTIDVFFPELIEIGDNTMLGYGSVILTHEFVGDELRTGRVIIGKNVTIGSNVTVLPGVRIGDGSIISAHSLVNRDIPEGVLAGGIPAKIIRHLESEDGVKEY